MSDWYNKNKKNIQLKRYAFRKHSGGVDYTYVPTLVKFSNKFQFVGDVNFQQIVGKMDQTEGVLVFEKMSVASPTDEVMVGDSWQVLKDYSCGIVTKNGSVLPQILIPSSDNNYVNNNLDGKPSQTGKVSVKWVTETKFEDGLSVGYGQKNKAGFISFGMSGKKQVQFNTEIPANPFAFLYKVSNSYEEKDQHAYIKLSGFGTNSEMTISQNADLIINVGGRSKTCSVTKASSGYDLPQIIQNKKLKDHITVFVYSIYNGLVVTSNISNSVVDNNQVIVELSDESMNAFANISPSLAQFPSSRENIRVVDGQQFEWEQSLKVKWNNMNGSFCYVPIYFAKKAVFHYYFKGQLKRNDLGQNITYTAYTITYPERGKTIEAQEVQSIEQLMSSYYRYSFELKEVKGNSVPQMFGFINVVKTPVKASGLKTGDGGFDMRVNSFLDSSNWMNNGNDWIKYVRSMRLNCTEESTTGQIVVDKYAIEKKLSELPEQSIGGLRLAVQCQGQEIEIFNGYTMQTSNDVSQGDATYTISLVGIQKKLQDLKLINAPFWDGDKVKDIVDWIVGYCDCDIRCNLSVRVPTSVQYGHPAINFQLGTSCLNALQELCEAVNAKLVLYPQGYGQFLQCNEQGYPKKVDRSNVKMRFETTDIISYNVSPYIENVYNSFLTMGTLVGQTPDGSNNPLPTSVVPGVLWDTIQGRIKYPWSRIIALAAPGLFNNVEELQSFHNQNIRRGSQAVYQGSINIEGTPESSKLKLYDKIVIDTDETSKQFYITGISHNIDFQSKTWTIGLSIGKID